MTAPVATEVRPARSRMRRWVALAIAVVMLGSAGAILAAHTVASHEAEESRDEFATSSAAIAATLQLAIQRDNDLIASGAAHIYAGATPISNSEFAEWTTSLRVLERYPEVEAFGGAGYVPDSELAAFGARTKGDVFVPPVDHSQPFQVTPPGQRPYYCLQQVALVRDGARAVPIGLDLCAGTDFGPALLAARASGDAWYAPYPMNDDIGIAVQIPIYRGGGVPPTLAARLDAFQGWFGAVIAADLLLDQALAGRPDMGMTFAYDRDSSNVLLRSGATPGDAHSATVDLHNGWTVTTFGTVANARISSHGNAIALQIAGSALSVLLGLFVFIVGTGRARALRLVAERTGELRHQALHDGLTGLPNRALVTDRVEQLLARNRRQDTLGAALLVDLDDFKNVNDTLGRQAGDELLVLVAARLQSTLRDADTFGRLDGDEFVVLIDGNDDGNDDGLGPALAAERLLAIMRQPFVLDGLKAPLDVTLSIGVAVGNRARAADLLRDAGLALLEAKAAGKNRYELYLPGMLTEIFERSELEFDLRSALQGGQYSLLYQPIYNLDDLSIVGVEALLRWDHPTHGRVQPDMFIPALEQSGQIREVGRWALLHACEQMAAWHARGDTLDISVNVSARQLDSDDIIGHVREALRLSGLEAKSLIIEITETALMRNVDATARRLRALKELGVRIAVDDFGTGYSSLAYLQQFPVDSLKIDRAFTNAITTSPESKALIATLVQFGKDLGLMILAEGVENVAQLDHLRKEHVDQAQGFLLARPLEPDTLEIELLAPTRSAAHART